MKSKDVDIKGVTFDLWNTLLVSEPGGIEVRQSAWQKVIDERDLNISSDLLLSVLEMLPVRFDVEWRAGRQYTAKEALEDKKYYVLLDVAESFKITTPKNYDLQTRWMKREAQSVSLQIDGVKNTYNYTFGVAETEKEKENLIRKFLQQLFRMSV